MHVVGNGVRRGGGEVFGGATCLCIERLIVVNLDFFAAQVILRGLNTSSFNIGGIITKFISVFALMGSVLRTDASHFLSLGLNGGSSMLVGEAFSATFCVRLVVTITMIILLRSFNV